MAKKQQYFHLGRGGGEETVDLPYTFELWELDT